ncbi:MAG: hypothetical protein HN348_36390, partial [Proteobacteria bacterium]|nr:hypothetical protein [Pseudomonadota bacterium]
GAKVASLGSGGGSDVLQALRGGASEVWAVEVIPYIQWLMTESEQSDFAGGLHHDPRVHVVTEDARAFVRRQPGAFDIMISQSSNSFAALASGGFALNESYLWTTEAFRDHWRALTPRGLMIIEHQFYVPRMVTSVLYALTREGVAEPTRHFAVWELPQRRRMVLLLSKEPLAKEMIETAFSELSWEPPHVDEASGESVDDGEAKAEEPPGPPMVRLWPTVEGEQPHMVATIATDGWRSVAESSAVDLSPSTDNRPFIAQLGLWRNLDLKEIPRYEFRGYPVGKLVLVTILLVTLVICSPLLVALQLGRGPRLGLAPWLYFFCLGAGFMAIEVVLIQQFTLLVGASS